jgi:hypothetical protein
VRECVDIVHVRRWYSAQMVLTELDDVSRHSRQIEPMTAQVRNIAEVTTAVAKTCEWRNAAFGLRPEAANPRVRMDNPLTRYGVKS